VTELEEHRYAILMFVVVIFASATIGGLIILAELIDLNSRCPQVWETCRSLNYPLGVIAAVGISYRLTLMAFAKSHWREPRALHTMLWFGYISGALIVAAIGSNHHAEANSDVTWLSGARLILTLGAIILTVWWPHPRVHTYGK
jgi:hypothetical protein